MAVSGWKMPLAVMAFLLLTCGCFLSAAAEEAKEETADEKEALFQHAVETAIAHMEKSRIYFKNNDSEKALKELKMIIKLDFPEGSEERDEYSVVYDSYKNAGMLLVKLDKPKEARLLVAEGVKIVPELSVWAYDLYMTQGKILEKLKMDEEAIKSYDKAMEISKKLEKAQKKKAAGKAKPAEGAKESQGEENKND